MWIVVSFLFYLVPVVLFADQNTYIGIKRFSISSPAMNYYQSIDVLLFQRLNFELLPQGIKPILLGDSLPPKCVAIVSGSIEIIDSLPYLRFKISGSGPSEKEEETKQLSLNDQPVDAIVDILVLKTRHFLEQNITGKLRISSTPLDCDIFLDGIKIGTTPVELDLEQGKYAVLLHRTYFSPFKDSAVVLPGRETTLSASMWFQGHNIKPWVITAALFTGCAIAAQVVESQFKEDYLALGSGTEKNKFDQFFKRYQAANAVKISLLIPVATTWTISAYHFFQNRALKKEIYGEAMK
ncbi:MAG: PEGA domain-containing protein [Chitinispirillaceae bacterium]|nr:PEGA domain-containing protein [Chitinispirillaceae bacterium]